jgi:hypothetical protein
MFEVQDIGAREKALRVVLTTSYIVLTNPI